MSKKGNKNLFTILDVNFDENFASSGSTDTTEFIHPLTSEDQTGESLGLDYYSGGRIIWTRKKR